MKKAKVIFSLVGLILLLSCRTECHDPVAINYLERGKHVQSLCIYNNTMTFYTSTLENGPIEIYYSDNRVSNFDSIGTIMDDSMPLNCQDQTTHPILCGRELEPGYLILKDSASIDTIVFNFGLENECDLIDVYNL